MTGFSQPERNGLERMQRAQTAQVHPDADLLTAFSEQTLTSREREQMLTHLAVCSACREVVALAAPPVQEFVVPQADAKPAFWNWSVLRWGAVAASAVIVVVAVSIGHYENKQPNLAPITTETAPMSAPATRQEVANEKTSADQDASRDAVTAAPATTGVKAPIVRYEKVAPKAKAPEAKKDAYRSQPLADAVSPQSQRSNNGTATGMVIGGAITNAPVRADANTVTAMKVGPERAGRLTATDETEARLRSAAPPPAPPPPPPTVSGKTAGARMATSEAVEVSSAQSMVAESQSVAIQPQAAPVPAANSMHGGALQKGQVAKKELPASADNRDKQLNSLDLKWQVTPDGYLLNSTDQGKNWARQLPDRRFTHVQTVGSHVWACGPNGALMHSVDGGTNWTAVVLVDKDAKLAGDITSIVFSDVDHGTLKTSTGQTWSTSDAGKSWKKN